MGAGRERATDGVYDLRRVPGATLTAEPIHELALALVSRGLTPGRDLIRTALPSGSTEAVLSRKR